MCFCFWVVDVIQANTQPPIHPLPHTHTQAILYIPRSAFCCVYEFYEWLLSPNWLPFLVIFAFNFWVASVALVFLSFHFWSFLHLFLGYVHCFILHTLLYLAPEGRPGISDAPPPSLSGISGLPVWYHFSILYISLLLLFCLALLLFLSYPFLLLAHSPEFFVPKPPFSER